MCVSGSSNNPCMYQSLLPGFEDDNKFHFMFSEIRQKRQTILLCTSDKMNGR